MNYLRYYKHLKSENLLQNIGIRLDGEDLACPPTCTVTGIKEYHTSHSPWNFILPLTTSMKIPVRVFTQTSWLHIPVQCFFSENEVRGSD